MVNKFTQEYDDYYSSSPLPGRNQISSPQYEHCYQGQFTEKDEEVNWDAFELRNWDGRLARWTTTDPYGQYWSPYLGMGNDPISGIDPDGGYIKGAGFFRNLFYSDRRILSDMAASGGGFLSETSNGFTLTTVSSNISITKGGLTSVTLNTSEQFFSKGQGLFSGLANGFFDKVFGSNTGTFEVSGTLAALGGVSFSFGIGRDSHGRLFDFNSIGPAIGADLSLGVSGTVYLPYNNTPLRASELSGDGAEFELGIGPIDVVSGGDLNRPFGSFGTLRNSKVNRFKSESLGLSAGSPIGVTFRAFNTTVNIWK